MILERRVAAVAAAVAAVPGWNMPIPAARAVPGRSRAISTISQGDQRSTTASSPYRRPRTDVLSGDGEYASWVMVNAGHDLSLEQAYHAEQEIDGDDGDRGELFTLCRVGP